MAWDSHDHLWVSNAFDGRYTLFDSTGAFLDVVPRPIHGLARLRHDLLFLAPDMLLDEAGEAGGAVFLSVDTLGVVIDTLTRIRRPERPHVPPVPSFDHSASRYLDDLVWTVAPDATIWMSRVGRLRLVQLSLDGDTLRVVETHHRNEAPDPSVQTHVAHEYAKMGVDVSDFGVIQPLVQAIHVLDDGHVLVQIAETPGEASELFDVFDPRGRYLGEMRLGFRITPVGLPGMRGDTLVAVAIGDMDVPFLVRAVFQRGEGR
jgi:hypothetical protein